MASQEDSPYLYSALGGFNPSHSYKIYHTLELLSMGHALILAHHKGKLAPSEMPICLVFMVDENTQFSLKWPLLSFYNASLREVGWWLAVGTGVLLSNGEGELAILQVRGHQLITLVNILF